MTAMRAALIGLCMCTWASPGAAQTAIDLENLSLPAGGHESGAALAGGFRCGPAWFGNTYSVDPTYGPYWEGFGYSGRTGSAAGRDGEFLAAPGAAFSGEVYAVGYVGFYGLPSVTFDAPVALEGAWFTNTAYTWSVMRDGDGFGFADPFDAADWLDLRITGLDAAGEATGTVSVRLGDGRSFVTTWQWADLASLGTVRRLEFDMRGSDVSFGFLNTPAYFAMDDLTLVPEPATAAMLALGAVLVRRRR